MQEFIANSLLGAISEPRFGRYLAQAGDNDALGSLACYLWNTLLSESLYPVLQGVEVTLRNSIRKAAAEKFGSAGWLDSVLVNPEQQHLQAARERLQNQSKDTGPDNLGRVHINISRGVRRIWKTQADGESVPRKWLIRYLKILNVNTP